MISEEWSVLLIASSRRNSSRGRFALLVHRMNVSRISLIRVASLLNRDRLGFFPGIVLGGGKNTHTCPAA